MVRTRAKKKNSIKSPVGSSTPQVIDKGASKKKKTLSPRQVERSIQGTSADTTSNQRKKNKRKQGTKALMEIRFYQNNSFRIIPRLPFSRLVREIMAQVATPDYRIQARALDALHESTEAFVVRYLEEANLCAIHGKRVTLMPKDMQLVKQLNQSNQSQSITN